MAGEAQAYLERLDYLRGEIKNTIHEMTQEELNWAPLEKDTNSAWVLAVHAAGTESFWIHQMVGGIDAHRNRDAEFNASGQSVAELETLLDKTAKVTHDTLQSLSSDELAQTKESGSEGDSVSFRYSILHTIEHLGQHLGHLTLTKQLYTGRNK